MAAFDSRIVVLGLRIAQAFLAVIILGLSGYVANWWSGFWHAASPSEVNFLLFCAVWSLLALLYLVLVPWRFSDTVAHHKLAILAVESITLLFWFAGFIAVAVFLSGRVCFGSVCSAAKAATVFGAFECCCSLPPRLSPSCTFSAPVGARAIAGKRIRT